MLKLLQKFLVLVFVGMIFVVPVFLTHIVNAQENDPSQSNFNDGSGSSYDGSGPTTGLRNPVNAGSLPQLLNLALKAVVDIGAIFGVLAIVYCGFLFLQAQGNESKLEEAKSAFYWTVIGLAILLGASVLEAILTNTINGLKSGL